ncbi:MAG: S8 family serine peptidase [Anaerolineae bacterium]
MKSKIAALLTMIMVLAMLASPVFASPLNLPVQSTAQPPAATSQSAPLFQAAGAVGPAPYFVILSEPSVPNYTGGISGFRATNPAAAGQTSLDLNSPEVQAYASHLEAQQTALIADVAQVLGRAPEVAYQIQYALNAVVMVLSPAEAAMVAKLPGVAQVERDTIEQIDTDYGPTWIGANTVWDGTSTGGLPGTKGEGVIIGVLDTGINMDHPSFADVGGDGFNHTNPFGSGNYKGLCASNPGQWVCNDKLVGYWIYTGETADDEDGHGSHTASTAGGNYLAAGTVSLGAYPYSPAISGVAPHANIIGYDVCTTGGCSAAAMVNAMNQAILDGVHVINVSISISGNTWTGAQQQGYLSVFNAGITPVRSAGNSGPGANTVGPHPALGGCRRRQHPQPRWQQLPHQHVRRQRRAGQYVRQGLLRRRRPGAHRLRRQRALQQRAVPDPGRARHLHRQDRPLRPRHQRPRGQGLERSAGRRGRHGAGQRLRLRRLAERRCASSARGSDHLCRRCDAQELALQRQRPHRHDCRHHHQHRRQQWRHHGRLQLARAASGHHPADARRD